MDYSQLYKREERTLESIIMQCVEDGLKDGKLVGEPIELFQSFSSIVYSAYEPTVTSTTE